MATHRRGLLKNAVAAAGFLILRPLRAETFLSRAEAQALIFPNIALSPVDVVLTAAQMQAIRDQSKMQVHQNKLQAWRSAVGDWFLLDQVIGKHEFIDLGVGISKVGAIVGIEILTYRESYGGEIRNPKWRAQFQNRKPDALPMRLDQHIRNISGATLSCRHVTDGVNRLLATWQQALAQLS